MVRPGIRVGPVGTAPFPDRGDYPADREDPGVALPETRTLSRARRSVCRPGLRPQVVDEQGGLVPDEEPAVGDGRVGPVGTAAA